MTGLKVYRHHRCSRRHRTYKVLAKCMLPHLWWIHGEGQFAVVAWCCHVTVSLYDDEIEALEAHLALADIGCGRRCTGRHEVIRLEKEA